MQAWLLSKESHSFAQLYANTRYESHPPLWHLLLMLLSSFTHQPFAIQLLHILLSSIAAFLFIRHAPFTLLQKAGMLFGYFFFFEYNLISRSYILTWLLLVIFCILFSKPRKPYGMLTICLVLLANTHFFSLLLSLPLFAVCMYTCFTDATASRKSWLLPCTIIYLSGVFFSLYWIVPPSNTALWNHSLNDFISPGRFSKTGSVLLKGFYPLLDITSLHFWNSNLLASHFKIIGAAVTAFLITIPFLLFYNCASSLFVFYASLFLLLGSFFFLSLDSGVRYMGYTWMLFLISCWLSDTDSKSSGLWKSREVFLEKWRERLYKPFLWSVILCQLGAGVYSYTEDLLHPFSQGKEVSSWIKKTGDATNLLIVPFENYGPTVSGYLDQPVFYPERNAFGTFCIWKAPGDTSQALLAERISKCMAATESKNSYVLLSFNPGNYRLMHLVAEKLDPKTTTLLEVRAFKGSIVPGEDYWVCHFEKKQ